MANVFAQMFGFGKKRDVSMPELANVKTPMDTAEGQKYKKTLEERMAGVGTGVDPSFLNADTASYAQSRKANLANYEAPTISAQASARGLGRSSIPVNRMALSTQEAGRDIEQRVAQLGLENEKLKSTQKSKAIDDYYAMTKDQVGAENARTQMQMAERLRQQGLSAQADAVEQAAMQKIGALGVTVGGAVLNPVLGGISADLAKSGNQGLADIVGGLQTGFKNITDQNASLVNIGGKNPDSDSLFALFEKIYGQRGTK